jgi:hypothetical protein
VLLWVSCQAQTVLGGVLEVNQFSSTNVGSFMMTKSTKCTTTQQVFVSMASLSWTYLGQKLKGGTLKKILMS